MVNHLNKRMLNNIQFYNDFKNYPGDSQKLEFFSKSWRQSKIETFFQNPGDSQKLKLFSKSWSQKLKLFSKSWSQKLKHFFKILEIGKN